MVVLLKSIFLNGMEQMTHMFLFLQQPAQVKILFYQEV